MVSKQSQNCISQDSVLRMLKQQSQYATVCTEPAMIALAVQEARKLLGRSPHSVQVTTSPGVFKNALSAGLPCGDRKGPVTAAALGAVLDSPDAGLELLDNITGDQLRSAYEMVDEGRVSVSCDEDHAGVYVHCTACTDRHEARIVISGSHTNISLAMLDGEPIDSCLKGSSGPHCSVSELRNMSFAGLLESVMAIDPEHGRFLLEGAQSIWELSERAAKDRTLRHALSGVAMAVESGIWDDLVFQAYHRTVAAISARMGGTPWPVLTSGGSGNQGVMVGLPVLMVANALQVSDEKKIRALLIGHSMNLYIKSYMGEISCVCGAVSAGAGVAAAVAWLLGASDEQSEEGVNMVLSSLYGMMCDGAKGSCALKGGLAAVQGIISAKMAVKGLQVPAQEGILGNSLEATLRTLQVLGTVMFGHGDAILIRNMGIC